MRRTTNATFQELAGKKIHSIEGLHAGSTEAIFRTDVHLTEFIMLHEQNCCESVQVEEVIGDVQDLIGETIVRAEQRRI